MGCRFMKTISFTNTPFVKQTFGIRRVVALNQKIVIYASLGLLQNEFSLQYIGFLKFQSHHVL